jgi:hypothetical protein
MHTTLPSFRRGACLALAAAFLAFPATRALADDNSQADAFPTFDNYIKVSGLDQSLTGDSAAYAARTGTPSTGVFGIEDFLYAKDVNDNNTLTVKGHALSGSDDYLADVSLVNDKLGSVDTGYSRFRTFYDGIGGFFPLSDTFLSWDPESLHVDRGSYWADVKLAMPDRPVFTLSFREDTRTGMKDSSEWGAAINPNADIVKGVLVGTALPTNTPYIAPNVLLLDEHHETGSASMVATLGKTTETAKLSVDTVRNIDSRDVVKYPGSTVIADPAVTVQDDLESRKSTSYRLLNETETEVNEQLSVKTGLVCTMLNSTNGGYWITPTYAATPKAVYLADTAAAIYGGSKVYDYVGNISVDYTPTPDWRAEAAYRQEDDNSASSGGFTNTSLATGAKTIAATNITTKLEPTYSHIDEHAGTPELNLEFLGIKNLDLYANFDKRIDKAGEHWVNPYAAVTTTGAGVVTTSGVPPGSVFFQDADQDNFNAKVGANWNASPLLTIRAEVYRKDDENQYFGASQYGYVGTGSYEGFFANDYTFTGTKISVIVKPLAQLTFNTRYQPQYGNMAVTANTILGGNGTEVTSGKVRAQMLSETVNWTPTQQVYVQGNVNVVYSYIQTSYPVVVVSSTTSIPTPIQNANNNYVTASALAGFVVDKQTDAQLRFSWTHANDYNPQIDTGGQPYGAGFLEESATAGLKHMFNARLEGDIKVGYLRRTDATTGGFTNYKGPLAYASITYSL